jgi:2-amino-4-hydroxy-6-hydroxymethyldihydropteridine diphosphokinase
VSHEIPTSHGALAFERWQPAYIALGSNLGESREQIARAFERLAALPKTRLIARSPLYGSAPFGPVEQGDFVNAVAAVLTQLEPLELLRVLKQLERELGREQPIVRWGPRLIDLDLVVYADQRMESPELTIPHSGITQRNFVLYPLRDLAPDLVVPGHGVVRTMASLVSSEGLRRLD